MLERTPILTVVLIAATAAGGCGTAQPVTSAVTAPCSTEAAASQAPNVVASQQHERVRTERDDNWAPVDQTAVASQGHRIEAAGAVYADAFGGVIFDPVAGELTVRYVNTSEGSALLKVINRLARHRRDVPVNFAEVDQPLAAMQALASELNKFRDWAGFAAPCIHEVSFNQLDYQLWIDASGAADQLVKAARARTGLTPGMTISPGYGLLPQ
ncbi:hypothetical protein [Nucisporomicrobium flavum]|uniref:hypothetical protein n=1 Tax=Nucisporomicrobium flavum TaxID=2785915 RepID=UPI0018F6E8AD|nr:hypothetical protein [Nucisporomicrobium flavum]